MSFISGNREQYVGVRQRPIFPIDAKPIGENVHQFLNHIELRDGARFINFRPFPVSLNDKVLFEKMANESIGTDEKGMFQKLNNQRHYFKLE